MATKKEVWWESTLHEEYLRRHREYVMFPQLAPSVDCDGSAVSLMSAASLWAALCRWAGTKRASIVVVGESWQVYVTENFTVCYQT